MGVQKVNQSEQIIGIEMYFTQWSDLWVNSLTQSYSGIGMVILYKPQIGTE